MFTVIDLEEHFDKTEIEVNGLTFKLLRDESLAGVLALWATSDFSYVVYATPDWEDISVSVEVFNFDSVSIGCEVYDQEIWLFEDYITIVKFFLKRILDKDMGIIDTA